MRTRLAAVLLVLIGCGVEEQAGLPPAAPVGPDPAKVAIVQWDYRDDSREGHEGQIRITGMLRNDNPMPVGAEVLFTGFDSQGRVSTADQFWPASIAEIAPGATYPIAKSFDGVAADMPRATLKVVRAKRW